MIKRSVNFLVVFSLIFVGIFDYLPQAEATKTFTYSEVSAYSDSPYVEINNNIPEFVVNEYTCSSFEEYSPLDDLGRCGEAYACVGTDLMPTEERGSISSVKPTGWQSVTYDFIAGKYLYNRCHLIGFQLTGENANRENLITGTRYLNIDGMLPFENEVAEFVKSTGYHVLYRVTPVFVENELVARGVLIEALSVEDKGNGICFCVFCYNVQPGVEIDYSTGASTVSSATPHNSICTVILETTYTVNINSGKFHIPTCSSVGSIKPSNKTEITATADGMKEIGYSPCGICKPDMNPKTSEYYYGDADLDGTITSADARLILRASVSLEVFDSLLSTVCDANRDGILSSADARLVLRAAVGLEYI